MPVKIVESLLTESEHKTEKTPGQWRFHSIMQLNSVLIYLSMPQSIPLIPPFHIPLFSSADLASQHSSSFCLFTIIAPYHVSLSMPAFLTPCITLAPIGTIGLLPITRHSQREESVCHSRLMPCSQTDQLLLVWNLSLLWRSPDREVMLSQIIANQVVLPRKL